MDTKKLIEEVLTDLANNKSLYEVKDKVRIIAKLIKDSDFLQWIEKEFITGYNIEENVPSYRECHILEVRANYFVPRGFGNFFQMNNQIVPIQKLGREVYDRFVKVIIRESVPSMERFLEQDEEITYTLIPLEMHYVQKILENCQIQDARKILAKQDIINMLNIVRTKLIDVFIDMNESIFNGELEFVPQKDNQIVQQIIHNHGILNTGNGNIRTKNSIVGGYGNTLNISDDVKRQINDIMQKMEDLEKDVDDDRTDIAQAIIDIKEELNQKEPRRNILKMGFNAIKGILADAATSIASTEIVKLAHQALMLLA